MKIARIFLISLGLCFVISIFGSYLMVRFILGSFDENTSQIGKGTWVTSTPVTLSGSGMVAIGQLESTVQSIASEASQAVVSIVITREVQTYRTDPFGFFYEPAGTVQRKVGGGTGFFISKEWYILTNKHVVSDPDAEYTVILSGGKELIGKILAYDPTTDLAIIRAFESKTEPYTPEKFLTFVSSQSDIRVGSFVVAVGNALAEFQNTLTFGVISGKGRQIEAGQRGERENLSGLIQTDTAINPGNSGGPLIGLSGKVIAVNTAISANANGIGFAIPLTDRIVNSFIKSVQEKGVIERSFLGIRYTEITEPLAKDLGLPVTSGVLLNTSGNAGAVQKDSPADRAGLRAGDIITAVDGMPIGKWFTLRDGLSEKLPGDIIRLTTIESSTKKTVEKEIALGAS